MQDTKFRFGRLVQTGLIAGALAGCGGSGGSEPATPAAPAAGEPSGEKHQCKAGHSCSGEMDMKGGGEGEGEGSGDAGAAPHVPE